MKKLAFLFTLVAVMISLPCFAQTPQPAFRKGHLHIGGVTAADNKDRIVSLDTGILACGISGQVLTSQGDSLKPNWTTSPGSNPMTAVGDIIRGGTSGAATKLSGNTTTTKKFLTQTGNGSASAAPGWNTILYTDESDLIKTYPLASDTTVSALTLTNSPISFAIAANESWTCTAKLYCTCDSSQGMKFAVTVPTSGTLKGEAIGQTTSVTATKYDPISTSGTATAAYLTAAASNGYVELQFTVKNSTNAGTVRIQFESISGGGNVTIKALSTLTATRLN